MTTRRQLKRKHRPYFVQQRVATVVKIDRKAKTITVDSISPAACERLRRPIDGYVEAMLDAPRSDPWPPWRTGPEAP